MAGTSQGAEKAAITKKQRYGPDYFRRLGKMGGNPVLIEQGKRKHDS
jgi:hypothetical protein